MHIGFATGRLSLSRLPFRPPISFHMSTFPSFEGQLNSTLIDSQRNPSLTTPAGSSKPPRRRQKSKPGASSEVVPAVVQASRAGSSKSGGNQGGGELRKKHSTEIGRSSGLSRGRGFSTTAGQIPRIKTADSSLLTPSNSTRNMSDFARRSADLPPPDSSLSIPWNAPETLDDVKVEAKVEPSARKRKTKSKKSKTKTEGEDGKDEDLAPSSADDSGPLLSQIVGETSAQSGAQPTVEEQILRLYEVHRPYHAPHESLLIWKLFVTESESITQRSPSSRSLDRTFGKTTKQTTIPMGSVPFGSSQSHSRRSLWFSSLWIIDVDV